MTQKYQFKTKGLDLKNLDSKGRVPTSIILSVALTLLQSFSTQASPEQSSQVLKLAENKRIEASICADSMNRIAVANDRITQIFGDEGTFESQNDEATGQVFLKPTAENGSKSLSLTLITEQGITQDLTLKPDAKSAKTLILGRDSVSQAPLSHAGNRDTLGYDSDNQDSSKNMRRQTNSDSPWKFPVPQLGLEKTLPIQEQLLTLLKHAITGQLPASEEEEISRPSLEGYSLTSDQSWQAGPYVVHALSVENVTETPLELQEKDFYQPGDLALSFVTRDFNTRVFETRAFQQRILAAQGNTTLYVVRYRKADLS